MTPVPQDVLHQVAKRSFATLKFLGEVLTGQAGSSLCPLQIAAFHLPIEGNVVNVLAELVVTFLVDKPFLKSDIKN